MISIFLKLIVSFSLVYGTSILLLTGVFVKPFLREETEDALPEETGYKETKQQLGILIGVPFVVLTLVCLLGIVWCIPISF